MLVGLALDARIMIRPPFDGWGPAGTLALLAACVVAGFVLGRFYFGALRTSTRWLTEGRGAGRVAGLAVLRLATLTAGLLVIVQAGGLPLLAATAGILAARSRTIRAVRQEET